MPKWPQKPARPVLRRSLGLARGLQFSLCAGWDGASGGGFRESAGLVTPEDLYNSQGDPVDAHTASLYAIGPAGLAMTAGSSTSPIDYPAPGGRYDTNNSYFSVACLVQPTAVPTGTQAWTVIRKRPDSFAADEGWEVLQNGFSSGAWTFEASDGVGEQQFSSGIVPVANEMALLTVTGDRSDYRWYVNGRHAATAAITRQIVNNTSAMRLGGRAANADFNGRWYMAAVWNRPLKPQEVAQLWTDPYVLWRASNGPHAELDDLVLPFQQGMALGL